MTNRPTTCPVVSIRTEDWSVDIEADPSGELGPRRSDLDPEIVLHASTTVLGRWLERSAAPSKMAEAVRVEVLGARGLTCLGVPRQGRLTDPALSCGPFRALYRCRRGPFGLAPIGVEVLVDGALVEVCPGADDDPKGIDLLVDMEWRDFVGWFPDPYALFGQIMAVPTLSGELSMISLVEGARIAAGLTTDRRVAGLMVKWTEAWAEADARGAISSALARVE